MSVISSSGSSYQPTAPAPSPSQTGGGVPQLVATTGPNGVALINGTQVILQWQAPNDGLLHRVTMNAWKQVTALETGGQVNIAGGGTMVAQSLVGGGSGAGGNWGGKTLTIPPGQLVQITQGTALTAGGPSTVYAEIWAS